VTLVGPAPIDLIAEKRRRRLLYSPLYAVRCVFGRSTPTAMDRIVDFHGFEITGSSMFISRIFCIILSRI
jgi:hypothetical protein